MKKMVGGQQNELKGRMLNIDSTLSIDERVITAAE